ncbi:hypothetical protein [Conexibacter sp. CPCC 206217]|uniref:hypothetical protein n=1 Tax=Conexibacter sp. CPCC 206217 TaxID=3064574 RepID=UPI0027192DA0|nr:hypothetical protein [Conexibacter sp. CPCC 206217]MDO8213442.1 hypothetical protein [Conexibacter sp. CPCC 206217]
MERAAKSWSEPAAVAGSDAERRAALALAARLREGGREVAVETVWVRPRWELTHALHAGLGVVASLIAVASPIAGLALALVALLSLLLDLSGRLFLLRRLTPERATQNVIASASARADHAVPGDGDGGASGAGAGGATPPLRVILTAHCDVPRGGLLRRLARGRGGGARTAGRRGAPNRPGAPLPGPFAWIVLALLGVAVCAVLRIADVDGSGIGAIQLVPTLVLLVALGLLLDAALSRAPTPAAETDGAMAPAAAEPGPSAPEIVLAAAQALDATVLRRVSVEVVIAGAGTGQALGFLAYLRRRRPSPERNVVIEIAEGAAVTVPTWWTRDGALLPLRYHPRLVALAAAAAADEPQLAARDRRGHAIGAALRARQRRIPAIRLAAPHAADALALTLALVELLDEEGG